jgi:K+-transporting ATPase ATPase C chain
MKTIINAILLTVILTLLTGFGYPLLITGAAQFLFHSQSNGSLATNASGQLVGSKLIAPRCKKPWLPIARSLATMRRWKC